MTASRPDSPFRVSAVIPNYNGRALLEANLPSLTAVFGEENVCVVDDASSDDSVDFVRRAFARVTVVCRATNGGFGAAVNDGLETVTGDLVAVINNDVETGPGFLEPLVDVFGDDTVFAAAPRMLVPDMGGADDGAKTGAWHHGMFYVYQMSGVSGLRPVIFTSGGMSVYRRNMLDELGGFDEAYSPFYWEDADLCYRAWKRGWRSVYQPQSMVIHRHSVTISKMPRARVDRVKARNSLFFIWRNISDRRLMRDHRLWLPLVLAKRALLRDTAFVAGWRDAFRRRSEARAARLADDRHRRLSDVEIMKEAGINV